MAAASYSQDYKQKIVGNWDIVKITNSSGTQTIPANAIAIWEFKADGTGQVNLLEGDNRQDFNFKWEMENNVIMLTDEKGPNVDKIQFGFFDDYLFLMKAPDDNMLLQRHSEKKPEEQK